MSWIILGGSMFSFIALFLLLLFQGNYFPGCLTWSNSPPAAPLASPLSTQSSAPPAQTPACVDQQHRGQAQNSIVFKMLTSPANTAPNSAIVPIASARDFFGSLIFATNMLFRLQWPNQV